MSGHYLKSYARHVQKVLAEDGTIERPGYQWCLQQVQSIIVEVSRDASGEPGETRAARVKALLVGRIRPNARRAG